MDLYSKNRQPMRLLAKGVQLLDYSRADYALRVRSSALWASSCIAYAICCTAVPSTAPLPDVSDSLLPESLSNSTHDDSGGVEDPQAIGRRRLSDHIAVLSAEEQRLRRECDDAVEAAAAHQRQVHSALRSFLQRLQRVSRFLSTVHHDEDDDSGEVDTQSDRDAVIERQRYCDEQQHRIELQAEEQLQKMMTESMAFRELCHAAFVNRPRSPHHGESGRTATASSSTVVPMSPSPMSNGCAALQSCETRGHVFVRSGEDFRVSLMLPTRDDIASACDAGGATTTAKLWKRLSLWMQLSVSQSGEMERDKKHSNDDVRTAVAKGSNSSSGRGQLDIGIVVVEKLSSGAFRPLIPYERVREVGDSSVCADAGLMAVAKPLPRDALWMILFHSHALFRTQH